MLRAVRRIGRTRWLGGDPTALAEALVEQTAGAVVVVDHETTIGFATPSAERLFDMGADQMAGVRLVDLIHPQDRAGVGLFLRRIARTNDSGVLTQWRVSSKDGTWHFVEVRGSDLTEDDRVGGFALTLWDVTEREELEGSFARHALSDPLTGAANRVLFMDRLTQQLSRRHQRDTGVAVLVFDVDDFRIAVSELGHTVADEVLCAMAHRIRRVIREADSVARVGGDEFALLLVDVSTEEVERVAERVLACFDEPFMNGATTVPLSVSLGWTIGSGNLHRAEDLVEDARLAMEMVKATGKGRAERYEPRMRDEAMRILGAHQEVSAGPGAGSSDRGSPGSEDR